MNKDFEVAKDTYDITKIIRKSIEKFVVKANGDLFIIPTIDVFKLEDDLDVSNEAKKYGFIMPVVGFYTLDQATNIVINSISNFALKENKDLVFSVKSQGGLLVYKP